MLDRLIATNRAAKGIAFQRIIARHFEASVRAAQLFKCQQDRAAFLDAVKCFQPLACFAEQFGGGTVKADPCGSACGIDIGDRFARHAFANQIDEIEPKPRVSPIVTLRQDNRTPRRHAVRYR